MQHHTNLSALLAALLMVVAVIAVLGWIRPVQVISTPDPYRAKFDSLQAASGRYQMTADSAWAEADYWHRIAEGLAYDLGNTDAHVREAEHLLNGAGVDSLRSVLMRKP
jgi:hypothetical protein